MMLYYTECILHARKIILQGLTMRCLYPIYGTYTMFCEDNGMQNTGSMEKSARAEIISS